MKKDFISVVLIGMLCSAMSASAANIPDTVRLDRGWLFKLGDDASASITPAKAKAEGWQEINIPHDFQIGQPWVEPDPSERPDGSDAGANIKSRLSSRGFKEMGGGWYVRSFIPAAEKKGKRALLDFEGRREKMSC